MAVDYLSALNAGSGLNTTQIIDSLVEAEKAPREAAIQEKIDEADVAFLYWPSKDRVKCV